MGGASKNVFLSRCLLDKGLYLFRLPRLRHQLQIDFITHSNPQRGIANATLMLGRNPKQVYIVFCPPVRGAVEMILTPRTFRRDFSHFCFPALFWLCWPNAGCRQPADCSHKETETWGGRTRFGCSLTLLLDHFSSDQHSLTTTDHEATSNDIITFCDIWQFVCAQQLTTLMEMTKLWRRSDPGEIEIYNTPLLCRHLARCWWRPRLSRQGWREAACHLGKILGSKALEPC